MIPIDELNLALASVNLGLLGVAVAKVHLLHIDTKQTRDAVYIAESAAETARASLKEMENLRRAKAVAEDRQQRQQPSAEDMAKDLVKTLQQQTNRRSQQSVRDLVGKQVVATGTGEDGSLVTVRGVLTAVTYRVYARAYNGSVLRAGQDATVSGVELTHVTSLEADS